MKRFLSIVLVCALLLTAGACSFSGNNTAFTMGVLDSVVVLDPIFADGDSEKIVAANCFEGLLRFDNTGKIDLAGATGYTVDKSSLKYTFRLNPEAVWFISDGAETLMESVGLTDFDERVTARDYIYGIQRYIENSEQELRTIKGAAEYQSGDKKAVSGLKAIDDYTLEITLKQVDPDFLYKLAALPLYPCNKDFCEALDAIYCSTPTTTLYNGPYYVKESSAAETIIERNPEYNGNIQVENKTVTLYSTGKASTLITRFEEGNYDLVITPDTEIITDEKAVSYALSSIWGLTFNCSSEKGANKTLRKLLAGTVNYEKIVIPDFALGEAGTIIPDVYTIHDDVYSSFEPQKPTPPEKDKNHEEKIDKILDEFDCEVVEIKFVAPVDMKKSAQAIIANWQKLFGEKLIVTLDTFEAEDSLEIAEKGNYDAAILPITPRMHTASSVIDSIKGAPCYYADKKITALQKKTGTTAEDAASAYSSIEKSLVSDGVFIPLFYTGSSLYLGADISGMYVSDGGNALYLYAGVLSEE